MVISAEFRYKTGSLVGRSTPDALTVISDIKEVFAYFSLSENDFMRFKNQFEGNTIEEKIKKMPPVELVLPDGSVYPQKGKVQIVAGQFDNSIGAISFRAVFPNTERLLRPAIRAKCEYRSFFKMHCWCRRRPHLKYRIKYLYLRWAIAIK